jgi:hypothetical protein
MRLYNIQRPCLLSLAWFVLWLGGLAEASIGDHLPEFKDCVKVCGGQGVPVTGQLLIYVQHCLDTNCGEDGLTIREPNASTLMSTPHR